MKTVLVATDLSDRSNIAVSRAIQIARQQDATLHVVHVIDAELPSTLADAQREAAESILLETMAPFENAGPIRTQISAVLGDPCKEINFKAMEIGADLIVRGRHRHRGLAEFFAGTTVERMARIATLPLLVVARPANSPYATAVVGVDFSKCATKAVSLAAALVGTAGLSLVHSYQVPFKGLTMRTDRHGSLSAPDRERIEAGIRREVDV
jgi:nucleotide-binding universal stress UspA family protein